MSDYENYEEEEGFFALISAEASASRRSIENLFRASRNTSPLGRIILKKLRVSLKVETQCEALELKAGTYQNRAKAQGVFDAVAINRSYATSEDIYGDWLFNKKWLINRDLCTILGSLTIPQSSYLKNSEQTETAAESMITFRVAEMSLFDLNGHANVVPVTIHARAYSGSDMII